jgi:acetate---CoA ligase (ADP-forming)
MMGLMRSLHALFEPASIAVVGMSREPASYSRRVLGFLRQFDYPGSVVGVHPNLTEVDGVPCYPTLRDIGSPVDLGLVFTPAASVLGVVRDAAESRTKALVVFSSGFAEVGAAGRALQDAIREVAVGAGMRVLGPNCQGVIHVPRRTIASFSNAAGALEPSRVGSVAYVGQSGAAGGAMFDLLRERSVTPAVWVSTGNQADVDVTELTTYLVDDPAIATILVYVEQTPDGVAWDDACRRVREAGKQLVVLHSGATEAGRRAAASHTGALVGERRAFELTSAAHGAVLVDDLDAMIDVALARHGGVDRAGRRLAIITTSGGAGSLASDWCERCGLTVAQLSASTVTAIDAMLPDFASSANPVDVTGMFLAAGASRIGDLYRIVSEDAQVDQTLLILTNTVGDWAVEVARSLSDARASCGAPVSVAYLAAADRTVEPRRIMTAAGIPVFRGVAAALRAIEAVVPPSRGVEPPPTPSAPDSRGLTVLTEVEGRALLDEIGVAYSTSVLVASADEAGRAARAIGRPVVLKVLSADLLHKTDVGAVEVGVWPEDAPRAYDALVARIRAGAPYAAIDGVLVQEQVDPGVELLVGVQGSRDGYRPLLTVGIGGTAVEIYGDVTTALAPVDAEGALDLLRALRGWPLLRGYRGRAPVDVDAAARATAAISRLGDYFGEALVDLEVNPLVVHAHGAHAVDFLCRLRMATP